MVPNEKIDRQLLHDLLKECYDIEPQGMYAVSLSLGELQKRMFPGKIAFYGDFAVNEKIASDHEFGGIFSAWVLRLKGQAKLQVYPGWPPLATANVLFDDLVCYPSYLIGDLDYNDPSLITTGKSLSDFKSLGLPYDIYNVPWLLFSGYAINIK